MFSNRYHINFWNYIDARLQDESTVELCKQLGFTAIMTGGGSYLDENEGYTRLLTACEKYGMEAVVFDRSFRLTTYKKLGRDAYTAGVKGALRFFEKFPAVKYAFVWDEPAGEDWQAMYEACEIIRRCSDKILPFNSLNHFNVAGEREVSEKLQEYMARSGSDIILYNCYSQCFACEKDKEQGLDNYFRQLRTVGSFALQHDIPFALSLISVGHWIFRVPTQNDIRWQLSTAAAHGATGFYWFHPFELPYYTASFRGYQVDQFGERSDTFYPLAYENKIFMRYIAARLQGFKLEKPYHVFRAYGGFPLFDKESDEIVADVENPDQRPLIVSRFRNGEGKRIVMVVNNSQTDNATVRICLTNGQNKKEYMAPGSIVLMDVEQ